MQYFQLFIKLVPFIFQAVVAAEQYFKDAGSGAEKKAAVKEGVAALYAGAKDISTGGQRETLETLDPLVDKAIDVAATFLFSKNKASAK